MRFTTISVAIALVALSVSTSLYGQRADDQIDPRSMTLLQQGRAAQAAGDLGGAIDSLETALVVDPRNAEAFIVLGDIARARSLPGKAIRYYRDALTLDPNDTVAMRGEGEALVQKGAIDKANEVLANVREICGSGSCPEGDRLAAAIAKGPPPAANATAANDAATPEEAQ
ncbi:tetratricopeptide repeat protein [Stakelama tenebrarum]|uniref:Tetratricopeptide repeat protein n=1 Tax=Stakelama tenebrarum TaxID=2711215 RepID=A0A6G6Y771_9SPHN|nr:tetratricopeptide repeat protein [Sphingosinithalassobacter tenebrarum]QIG80558.1 tetratricopeptide repeat protein [Sphingosinithalassobacter tenebrarum]